MPREPPRRCRRSRPRPARGAGAAPPRRRPAGTRQVGHVHGEHRRARPRPARPPPARSRARTPPGRAPRHVVDADADRETAGRGRERGGELLRLPGRPPSRPRRTRFTSRTAPAIAPAARREALGVAAARAAPDADAGRVAERDVGGVGARRWASWRGREQGGAGERAPRTIQSPLARRRWRAASNAGPCPRPTAPRARAAAAAPFGASRGRRAAGQPLARAEPPGAPQRLLDERPVRGSPQRSSAFCIRFSSHVARHVHRLRRSVGW